MMIRKTIPTLAAVLALVVLTGAAVAAPLGDAYPLDTCPVSGGKLGSMGAPFAYTHEGRDVKFCCKGCLPKFKADPAKFLAKIDAAIVKEQAAQYPLKTCVVSGKPIDGDVKPVDHVFRNRLVRLHDSKCVEAFAKSPRKYMIKLDKAVIAEQKGDYPLTTCVISGGKLGGMGAIVDYVHAGRLVRFCCNGCIGAFRKNPAAVLAKIDAAKASSTPAAPAPKAGCGGEGCGSDGCGSGGCGDSGNSGGSGGCGGGGCGGK